MSIFLNPVVFSVILMCILCLCKLNVMFSLIIACFVGGLMGGMSVSDISSTMLAGFSNNAEAALAYILLGTFASCLAYTGLADIFAKRVAQAILQHADDGFIVFNDVDFHCFLPLIIQATAEHKRSLHQRHRG